MRGRWANDPSHPAERPPSRPEQSMWRWQQYAETTAAAGHWDVVQAGFIGDAEFPRDIEPEARAVLGRRIERPEQPGPHALWNAGAAVHHVDRRLAAQMVNHQRYPRG